MVDKNTTALVVFCPNNIIVIFLVNPLAVQIY